MKTKNALALRCSHCQRNLPADQFRLRDRLNDRGYRSMYREQPCRECRNGAKRARYSPIHKEATQLRMRLGGKALRPRDLYHNCPNCGALYVRWRKPCGVLEAYCPDCHRKQSRERMAAKRTAMTPEQKAAEIARLDAWNEANPGYKREYRRQRRQNVPQHKDMAKHASKKGYLTKSQWQSILVAFDNKCAYCDQPGDLHREHVVPFSAGGRLTSDNTVPACPRCNSLKNDKPLREWLNDEDRYQFVTDMLALNANQPPASP